MQLKFLYILFSVLLALSCSDNKKSIEVTPWGSTAVEDSADFENHFTISDLQSNGEMIMLTMSGPDTYFDYRGRGMGTQYLLCEKFAHDIGVSLRVELCRDTAEMLERLEEGEGDIIVYQMSRKTKGLNYCGYGTDSTSWAVSEGNKELSDSLNRWYRPQLLAQIKKEEAFMYSPQSIRRHTYSPMLNASAGIISEYDHLFQKYAPLTRWDWRLLAAQCYQESTFDPNARSWAGACGLMQIMPATADMIGLSRANIFDPEENIAAAARYIKTLNGKFLDIRDRNERCSFILASYNGGFFHIRDAMALTKKHGRNPHSWRDVSEFVLKLSYPEYYNDPVVKYGYMRGQETAGYVESIKNRWAQYRSKARGGSGIQGFPGEAIPQKARKKHRFRL